MLFRSRGVRRVVPRDDDAGTSLARLADHAERGLSHLPEAHLRKPVENVVVENDDVRPGPGESICETRGVLVERRIEESDLMSKRPQIRRRRDRCEGWVRFADRELLAIEPQQMTVGKEDATHG